jgi:hypothetical protein
MMIPGRDGLSSRTAGDMVWIAAGEFRMGSDFHHVEGVPANGSTAFLSIRDR